MTAMPKQLKWALLGTAACQGLIDGSQVREAACHLCVEELAPGPPPEQLPRTPNSNIQPSIEIPHPPKRESKKKVIKCN